MTSSTAKGQVTLSCRQVLNIMVFFGFMFNYMLRVNLNIAIVEMAEPVSSGHHGHVHSDQCGGGTTHHNATVTLPSPTQSVISLVNASINATDSQDSVRFDWNAHQQNLVLGSFLWGYLITELPGGRLAEVFGARRVFGYSMMFSSILTLLTPFAAKLHYLALVTLRAGIGFLLGVTWPAMLPLAARWIHPQDRSKFMSNMMASSLGAAITMPVCAFLISSLGWESVFLVTGSVGVAWSIVWFLLIFDSPAQHPRISPEEKRIIESALGSSVNKAGKHPPVPWRRLLTSGPVWAIILTHVANIFGFFTVVNQLPTFMKYILGFNIKQNGWASSLPYLGKYLMALTSGFIGDAIRKSDKLSLTTIRKIFTTLAVGVPGILMIIEVFVGCNRMASVAIFTLALTFNGCVTAGYLANGLDIAPNYSGTIFGMANMLSSAGGYLSTVMVAYLTDENQTYGQWQIIFGSLSVAYLVGACMYLILGTATLQSWNSPSKSDTQKENGLENGSEEVLESVPLQKPPVEAQ